MKNSLRENNIIRILLNIIIGVVLFQILFGFVFNGSSAGAIESLAGIVLKLGKVVIILAVSAGILLVLKNVLARKGEGKLMNFNRDQVIKGIIIGILALIAFGLLSNLFSGSGTVSGPGYYGHGGGEGAVYGYNGGISLSGLLSNILSLLITLMSVALVVFLALGAYKAAAPYLNGELGNLFNSSAKKKCAKCEKELSADWLNCPYCGTLTAQPADTTPEPAGESIAELAPALEPELKTEPELESKLEPESEPEPESESEPVPDNPAIPAADRKPADTSVNKPSSKKFDHKKRK